MRAPSGLGPGRRGVWLRTAVAVVISSVGTVLPDPAAPQVPPAMPPAERAAAPPPTGDAGYRATAVAAQARSTVVAVALRLPAGSSLDPPGLEGTASLLAQVVRDEARRALGPGVATVSASVDRGTTTFTALVVPDAWPRAREVLDSVVFSAPVDGALLAPVRTAQLERISFEDASPGVEFQAEAARLLAGPDSAWARPVRGTARSLAAVDPGALERYRADHYRRDVAVRAVVGPRSVVAPAAADTSTAAPADTAPRLAWTRGSRVSEVRDVTSTWIRMAYPVSSSIPRTTAEMLAAVVHTELTPTPPDPDRYGVDVSLRNAPGGTVLVVDATVFPEAADRWEAKITQTVQALAAKPMDPDFFTWRRRRFRTERLLEEAAPEAEAERMAADLLRDGRVRDLDADMWSLDADALHRAAQGLGEPRVLRFGPDLREGPRLPE